MCGCVSHVWEKHLVHHLTTAQDKTHQDQKELEDLQAQLLKLQLTKARQEVNDKKKGKPEQVKVMVQAAQSNWDGDIGQAHEGSGDRSGLSPLPSWEPHPRRREGGLLGRGQRGGSGRGAFRGNLACYICGDPNHWARACPYNTWTRTGPQRGTPNMRGGQGNGPTHQQARGGGAS